MHSSSNHVEALRKALESFDEQRELLISWGGLIAGVAARDGRVLVVGNGGSAAQAQHLTAELVGRYCHDRSPISALALHSDTSSLTAIVNDFGADQLFARQVRAHGRPRDLLIALSTSGKSPNIIEAALAARQQGMRTLAFTGPGPNPLADVADQSLLVTADEVATVQEIHLVAIHLICAALDEALGVAG